MALSDPVTGLAVASEAISGVIRLEILVELAVGEPNTLGMPWAFAELVWNSIDELTSLEILLVEHMDFASPGSWNITLLEPGTDCSRSHSVERCNIGGVQRRFFVERFEERFRRARLAPFA